MTILWALFDKFRLHGVNDGFLFLTHSLTQSITFTACEVSQLAWKQHHLLLINSDAIGVLEVFFHARNVVGDERRILFAFDELRNVVHRSRPIECIHRNEVFENSGVELTKIFLHAWRFKLACADGAPLLIELIGEFVVNRDGVEVDFIARCFLHNLASLF